MSRNLLFISRYPDIVKEFVDAMSGSEVEIDTALNGTYAAAKLKKKEYQVVVTGLSLEGYNGEQIITYLNKNFPDTVCIIYATTISFAQLQFFMNERSVFRVFLRPVGLHKELFETIEEAFEYRDAQMRERQDWEEQETRAKQQRKECAVIDHRMSTQEQAQGVMNRYMKRMAELSLKEYAGEVDAEQQMQIGHLEGRIVDLCCGQGEHAATGLEKAGEVLEKLQELRI